jgi:hypothetical protein
MKWRKTKWEQRHLIQYTEEKYGLKSTIRTLGPNASWMITGNSVSFRSQWYQRMLCFENIKETDWGWSRETKQGKIYRKQGEKRGHRYKMSAYP